MKVLHIPFTYFPDPIGGTEVYVRDLIENLRPLGVESVVLADSDRPRSYFHDGVPVHRVALPPAPDLRHQYGLPVPALTAVVSDFIDAERPNFVHIHAPTWAATPTVVEEFHRRDIPVVFTYHSPVATCQRGTLMRWGKDICDGLLDLDRCTACTLQAHGLPRQAARLVAHVPAAVGERVGRSGGAWTALRMRELMSVRLDATRMFLNEVDRIVVLSDWSRRLLMSNGVASERISLSRHGIDSASGRSGTSAIPPPPPLRVAFLGRIDPVKGVDILVRALQLVPDASVSLDFYGITQGTDGERYLAELRELSDADERIRFLPSVPSSEVVSVLRDYHVLAVPSRWLETGPLVVLEAFAAGVPVIGMDRGGISELLQDGENGLLVNDEAPETWRDAIIRLKQDPRLLRLLQNGVKSPRSTRDVAEEMEDIYRDVLYARAAPLR